MTVIRQIPESINEKYVTTSIAAKLLGLTRRHVDRMCSSGIFKSAHKPGYGTKAHWRILRAEISAHIYNGHKYI